MLEDLASVLTNTARAERSCQQVVDAPSQAEHGVL